MKSLKPLLVALSLAALLFMFSGCTEQVDNPFRTQDPGISEELGRGDTERSERMTSSEGEPWGELDVIEEQSSKGRMAPGKWVTCGYISKDPDMCPPPHTAIREYSCYLRSPYTCPEDPDRLCTPVRSYCLGTPQNE